jgi:hypothetical protein
MITLEDYINESILEAKAKAEAPKEVVEWFNEAVYSNKKDFGQEKKLKQYKDGGFGLMPGQFAKDRWGEGWFAIRLFEEKNPEKFIEIPEGVSEDDTPRALWHHCVALFHICLDVAQAWRC